MIKQKEFFDESLDSILSCIRNTKYACSVINTALTTELCDFVCLMIDVFEPISECTKEVEGLGRKISKFATDGFCERKNWKLKRKLGILKLFLSCRVKGHRSKAIESFTALQHDCNNKLNSIWNYFPHHQIEKVENIVKFMKNGVSKSLICSQFEFFSQRFLKNEITVIQSDFKKISFQSLDKNEKFSDFRNVSHLKKEFEDLRRKMIIARNDVELFFKGLDSSSTHDIVQILRLFGQYRSDNLLPRKRTDSKSSRKKKKKIIRKRKKNMERFYYNLEDFNQFIQQAHSRIKKIRKSVPKYLEEPKEVKKYSKVFRKNSKILGESKIVQNFKALKDVDQQKNSYFEDMLVLSENIDWLVRCKGKIFKGLEEAESRLGLLLENLDAFEQVLSKKWQAERELERMREECGVLERLIGS